VLHDLVALDDRDGRARHVQPVEVLLEIGADRFSSA
jgi:hypothetical protein